MENALFMHVVSWTGGELNWSTSIYVDIENWDNIRQEIAENSQEARILNNRLLKFVSSIYDIYNQLEAGKDDFEKSSYCRRF